jgi:hypothetical protein
MTESTSSKLVSFMTPLFLFIAMFLMSYVFKSLDVDIKPILAVVIALTPIWLPYLLFHITFEHWLWFVREKYKHKNGRTTLRIKLPQEVLKSPEAMESIFTQIHNSGRPDNLMQTYLDGKHGLVHSFEIVSIGGEVRFYANVPTQKAKNALEVQLYAQYPGIEITEELIDYTAEVKWNPKEWDMISFHMGKRGASYLPIKTYIDYGLDKQPKEELKFEPMAPLIEHLGSAKPHERIWVQILITAHDKLSFKSGNLGEVQTWEVEAIAKVNEMMKRDKNNNALAVDEFETRSVLTLSDRDTVAAIERNISKYAYNFAIRAMYITKAGKFDGDMISPLLRSFAQYDLIGRNSIGVRWRTDFDYNFISDFSGQRKRNMKKSELESYKKRFYLHGDNKTGADKMKVLSVEELATMFHIPGSSIITPNLARVESNRKEAPANLPIKLPTN